MWEWFWWCFEECSGGFDDGDDDHDDGDDKYDEVDGDDVDNRSTGKQDDPEVDWNNT